ncbi:hypothetical protein ACFL1D_00075 [Candidatus Omnitrophota bacterium]
MTSSYKLSNVIKDFIIEKKKASPELSCRRLIPLIREKFQVSLSKSLINSVIKQSNLSSPVGRRSRKQQAAFSAPAEIKLISKERVFIEYGGIIFLKIADFQLSLTSILANGLFAYFPGWSEQDLQTLIETALYMPFFKDKKSLWLFTGKEVSPGCISQYLQQLANIKIAAINNALMRANFSHNINKINELHKECLLELSSYAQTNFFPHSYQYLGLPAMQERFYALWANFKKTDGLLEVQFFCPEHSPWMNDAVWHEDLLYAAEKINSLRVFSPEKELVLVDAKLEILPKNLP